MTFTDFCMAVKVEHAHYTGFIQHPTRGERVKRSGVSVYDNATGWRRFDVEINQAGVDHVLSELAK